MKPTTISGNPLFSKVGPTVGLAGASALANDLYGIQGVASVLTSERDLNFLIRCDDGKRYVLKVTHPSEDPGVTDFQTKAQLHVMHKDPLVPVPALFTNRVTQEYVYWREIPAENQRQAVRLISFVEGKPLYQTQSSPAQRASVGKALAGFDAALADFSHPQMNHHLLWDLQHLMQLAELLEHIDDQAKRALAQAALARFQQATWPALSSLRRQVIHNDLNAYNVMVSGSDSAHVSGILDFGDMVQAPLVQDLAVACAYQLAESSQPLETAIDCIKAYQAENPLTREELSLIPDLISARLLTTVLITEWRAKQHPENRSYILRNNPLSWSGLERLSLQAPTKHSEFVLHHVI